MKGREGGQRESGKRVAEKKFALVFFYMFLPHPKSTCVCVCASRSEHKNEGRSLVQDKEGRSCMVDGEREKWGHKSILVPRAAFISTIMSGERREMGRNEFCRLVPPSSKYSDLAAWPSCIHQFFVDLHWHCCDTRTMDGLIVLRGQIRRQGKTRQAHALYLTALVKFACFFSCFFFVFNCFC